MRKSQETIAIDSTTRGIRVLFDSPAAWPLLSPGAVGGIGGAELRAVTFARELARRPGFVVHVMVRDGGSAVSQVKDRITIHVDRQRVRTAGPGAAAWMGLRRSSDRLAGSLLKRIAGIPQRRRSIEKLDYDVLCCFGVNNRSASLVRSAHHTGRHVVLFLTSDRSLSDVQLRGRRQRGVYGELGGLCRFALRSADAVVVQTRWQQVELLNRLGIVARLIRNPIDLQTCDPAPNRDHLPADPYVLWVGRADTFSKRADLCWELARACPEISFLVIMNAHERIAFEQLQRSRPANVQLIPFVPFDEIERHYRHAALLVNTSDAEGFPNSFLQAGKYGVPIVSLNVDPDGMLSEYGAGVYCRGSMTKMKRQLCRLIERGPEYDRMAGRILQYTRQFHELRQRADELSALLDDIVGRRTAA